MLAIVIPYFKISFFEDTLLSLANQTDKRFKVYIGDDASPENPNDLLAKYREKFEIVYHRFANNLGGVSLIKQWERCIALTEAEKWIMILGDDDFLGNDVVASWYKNYNIFNEKSKVIRFASQLIYEESKSVSAIYNHPVWEKASDSFYRKFARLSRSSLSEYVFSKASYEKYGFHNYPLAWNSDDRAWLDFSDNKPIFTINESIVFVRMSVLNISGRADNIQIKNLSEIEFYKFMVSDKLKFYKREQRLRLMRKYQSEIKKTRNLRLSEWFFLLFFYLKYFNIDWFKKVCKKASEKYLKSYDFRKGQ
jgi:glycosyltransferase involved in cell wall biosynthesis